MQRGACESVVRQRAGSQRGVRVREDLVGAEGVRGGRRLRDRGGVGRGLGRILGCGRILHRAEAAAGASLTGAAALDAVFAGSAVDV